ncbi:MAG: primosomal protein N' [Clostridiales bacterium]|nr:primosomal protein N' [Clostridiales bacterium]
MESVYYGRVAVAAATYAIDKPYTYLFPREMAQRAAPGMRVLVPFSQGNRPTEGIVLSLWEGERIPNIKSVQVLLDEQPVLSPETLKLAMWMRDRYFCTVYTAAKAMLPAGLYYAARDTFSLAEGVSPEDGLEQTKHAPLQAQALEVIRRQGGKATREQIYHAFGDKSPAGALKALTEKGLVAVSSSVSRNVGDKTEQVAYLTVPLEEALSQTTRGAKAQRSVLQLLGQVGSASLKDIHYFTGTAAQTVRALEKKGLVALYKREVYRRPASSQVSLAAPPVLNDEQQAAYEGISALLDGGKPACALLYGVTGSGKTQVYIQLIHKVIGEGRTALVLVPEIALTPQLLHHFEAQFGSQVAILHSSLSAGARYDEWKRAKNGDAKVVVGTRSAVFAPLENLGLIVLDEEQEGSYQSGQSPRYHARDVAKYRSAQSGAVLVLGSATPSVESMYLAQKGVYHLFRLKNRFNAQSMPQVRIVDMRQELRGGNLTNLSGPLRAELRENLERGEQTVLFLNRRGTSRMVVCGECGATPECPHCSVKLTYHKDNQRLMCHYCGYSQEMVSACPDCGGDLYFVDAGVQMVQEQLEEAFPGVEVLRMDADSVSAAHNHADILSRFQQKKIPILLGTQMVAKGLDFENVTLVGVVDADQGLYVSSYRAGERTFSLLTQVVGRAGRGSRAGRAIIQTFTPKNDIITCAARQDYDAFYESEILLRESRQTPPVRDLYQLTVSGPMEHHVLQSAHRLRTALQSWQSSREMAEHPFSLYGPAEAPVLRVMGRYRYRLMLVCKDHKKIREMLAFLLKAFQQDRFNKGIGVSVELNPMD